MILEGYSVMRVHVHPSDLQLWTVKLDYLFLLFIHLFLSFVCFVVHKFAAYTHVIQKHMEEKISTGTLLRCDGTWL